jgi:beta-N-acetylhexosaminidase
MLAGPSLSTQIRTPLDRDAERWVARTLADLNLDRRIGQMFVSAVESTYISSDSDQFDAIARLVRDLRVGGVHVFGGTEPAPAVLLNSGYGSVTLGQPLSAAATLNRLQGLAAVPLLVTADFETGAGFRIGGATNFPRAMAFGAAGDVRLAFEAGRVTAAESRAIGVHVNFAPVVDVNNNPRNPVINTRSFGEDPVRVGALGTAFVEGLHAAGMFAALKHFPGHGDTDVDSHIGLPIIRQPRGRLEALELMPFRRGIAAGADAVMIAHIQVPALDAEPVPPATLSRAVVTGLLRGELRYDGLVYTDSMRMDAIARMLPPGEAAVRAVNAGVDVVLLSPDDDAALAAVKAAVEAGEIPRARIDRSVERILRAKARARLHRVRVVGLDAVSALVGTRVNRAIAQQVSERSVTLVKDERGDVPLRVAADAPVLFLSVLDYPTGWRIAAPSRTFQPELAKRWPKLTAAELSDRTTTNELDLIRAAAARHEAIVAAVYVRAASGSGRMDLSPPLVRLLQDLARGAAERRQPMVTVLFGNPYVAAVLPELPAVILTYDLYDLAEQSAVRALAGEAPIGGRLPVALPGLFPVGHGLDRAPRVRQ